MCMVYNDDGSFLVQNRTKNDWPGINFPGGHVEDNETIIESCIREIKEETGLDIWDLYSPGSIEWYVPEDNKRHLCIIYITNKYKGEIKSSNEGDIFFLKEDDLKNYNLSLDFDKVLEIAKRGIKND